MEQDSFFQYRQDSANKLEVVKTINFDRLKYPSAEDKRHLPHPSLIKTLDELSFSERAVNNLIDAVKKGLVDIKFDRDQNLITLILLPLVEMPPQLGHVTTVENLYRNINNSPIFGNPDNTKFTYLQTTGFAVEGNFDDRDEGSMYGRVYLATSKLKELRNIYFDPESFYSTDYEYPHGLCVLGGLPASCISHIEMVKTQPESFQIDKYVTSFPAYTPESIQEERGRNRELLLKYINTLLIQ